MPTKVFVSHSHADQPFAERLLGVLRHHRIPFWYSDTHISGAQQWHDEIGNALQRCDWFILVLSPDSVASIWVLSWTLPRLQSIDFSRSFDDGCRELLRIWNVQYAPVG